MAESHNFPFLWLPSGITAIISSNFIGWVTTYNHKIKYMGAMIIQGGDALFTRRQVTLREESQVRNEESSLSDVSFRAHCSYQIDYQVHCNHEP